MAPTQPTTAAPADDIPQLTYTTATTDADKRDTLRLVADTIAQQRQVASNTIIFHPYCLGPLVALLSALVYRSRSDPVGAVILVCGFVVAYLAAVQYYTYSYLQRAEDFHWKDFITPSAERPEEQDTVLFARYGSHIVATLVLRLQKPAVSIKSTLASKRGNGCTAEIRAWATRLRYRNTGLGGDMLREAVALTRSTLGPAAAIQFSSPHAHTVDESKCFTGPFALREQRARQALGQAVKNAEAASQ